MSENYKKVKTIKIKPTKNELIIEVDLKETFEGKEVNLNNEKMYIMLNSMVQKFKKGEDLPASQSIKKKSTSNIFFSKYPIVAKEISVYIPAKLSGGEATAQAAANIGSQVVKPVTVTLMVVSMPVAITLMKIL